MHVLLLKYRTNTAYNVVEGWIRSFFLFFCYFYLLLRGLLFLLLDSLSLKCFFDLQFTCNYSIRINHGQISGYIETFWLMYFPEKARASYHHHLYLKSDYKGLEKQYTVNIKTDTERKEKKTHYNKTRSYR